MAHVAGGECGVGCRKRGRVWGPGSCGVGRAGVRTWAPLQVKWKQHGNFGDAVGVLHLIRASHRPLWGGTVKMSRSGGEWGGEQCSQSAAKAEGWRPGGERAGVLG